MNQDPFLIILIPWLASLPPLFGKAFGRRGPFVQISVLAFVTSALPLWRLWQKIRVHSEEMIRYQLGGWAPPVGISLAVDELALILAVVVFVVGLAVSLFSLARRHFEGLYFAEVMILIGALQGVLVVRDLFTLFVCFEIAALAVYLLIAYEREAPALVASFKYLILSSLGILFFLFGVFVVYRETGTLSLWGPFVVPPESEAAMHLGVAALVVGIGVRTAFIPFHTWLPEAHAYASHPISALLSGVVIKVSFFAMVRVLDVFQADYFYEPLLWIGAITAFAAVVRALAQRDVKKLLAYHSISQMGYVLAALGAATVIGRSAAVHHAVNHAFFKSLLFLTVGYAVALTGRRNVFSIPKLARREPLMALAFWIGALAIAGIPPLNGFVSKTEISRALKGLPAYPLIWATGVGTVASFIKLGRIYSFGAPVKKRTPSASASRAPADPQPAGRRLFGRLPERAAERLPVLALAALCVAGGIRAGLPSFSELSTTAVTLVLGVGLYFGITQRRIKALMSPLRFWNPSLQTVLTFFFLGLFVFGGIGYLR